MEEAEGGGGVPSTALMLVGLGGTEQRGLVDGCGFMGSCRMVELSGVRVAPMASLTKVMQIFNLKSIWWIDGGDDFFSVHHRDVR